MIQILKVNLREGVVRVRPEVLTDLYVLKNVIFPGDLATARTSRRVRKSEKGNRETKVNVSG